MRCARELPAGVELSIVRDNSEMIRHSVEDVIFELVLGAILTVLVVMLFLNDWKATAITSLALPVSVISSFVLMNALGFTLNVLTLMGLSLSIGILIDDAIVVIENIVRHREMGRTTSRPPAAGTREIFLAVMATTFSIVAVFVPVAFMGGIIGRFFYEFGMTVAWAVLVSLFVSFTLTPMLSGVVGRGPAHRRARRGNSSRAASPLQPLVRPQAERYRGVVDWALRHRKTTLGIAGRVVGAPSCCSRSSAAASCPSRTRAPSRSQFETPEGSSLDYTRGGRRDRRRCAAGGRGVHLHDRRRRCDRDGDRGQHVREARPRRASAEQSQQS
jgi:hydrophobic/amphiphilic exporter-1 (mainly G- bacteria), HAE1 family